MLLWTFGTPLLNPEKVDFDLRLFPKPYVFLLNTRISFRAGSCDENR